MMSLRLCLIFSAAVFWSSIANAQLISTEFSAPDFTTGDFNPVTLTSGAFGVTFSGGQQQQMFDGGSYNNGPAGYLFLNTGPGAATFVGSTGNAITGGANNGDQNGLITFSGPGAGSVSFYAADRANGTSSFEVFDTAGASLGVNTLGFGNLGDAGTLYSLNFGSTAIGSIAFDLAGPAANPPYVVAIDTFSATAAVPEPASAGLIGLVSLAMMVTRRRKAIV